LIQANVTQPQQASREAFTPRILKLIVSGMKITNVTHESPNKSVFPQQSGVEGSCVTGAAS
jgi:hypothetical protein